MDARVRPPRRIARVRDVVVGIRCVEGVALVLSPDKAAKATRLRPAKPLLYEALQSIEKNALHREIILVESGRLLHRRCTHAPDLSP